MCVKVFFAPVSCHIDWTVLKKYAMKMTGIREYTHHPFLCPNFSLACPH